MPVDRLSRSRSSPTTSAPIRRSRWRPSSASSAAHGWSCTTSARRVRSSRTHCPRNGRRRTRTVPSRRCSRPTSSTRPVRPTLEGACGRSQRRASRPTAGFRIEATRLRSWNMPMPRGRASSSPSRASTRVPPTSRRSRLRARRGRAARLTGPCDDDSGLFTFAWLNSTRGRRRLPPSTYCALAHLGGGTTRDGTPRTRRGPRLAHAHMRIGAAGVVGMFLALMVGSSVATRRARSP